MVDLLLSKGAHINAQDKKEVRIFNFVLQGIVVRYMLLCKLHKEDTGDGGRVAGRYGQSLFMDRMAI